MNKIEPQEEQQQQQQTTLELKKIVEDLGISYQKIAEILNVKYPTLYDKMAKKRRHKLNQHEVDKIKDFLKEYVKKF